MRKCGKFGRKCANQILYEYRANPLVYTFTPPLPATVPAGAKASILLTLSNPRTYPVNVNGAQLRLGTAGFTIDPPSLFPTMIPPMSKIDVRISFQQNAYDRQFEDILLMDRDCRTDTLRLAVRTDRPPKPYLAGIDWKERRVTTLDTCTKSGVAAYDSLIAVFNLGRLDISVASLDLIGRDADDGYFVLDRSDPATTVDVRTVLRGTPEGAPGETSYQKVLFRPRGERLYSCSVRLITDWGDTVWSTLEGRGIESHVAAAGYSFARVAFAGATTPEQSGTAVILSAGTRALTITALPVVGPAADRFRVDQADLDQLPKTLAPRESWTITVHYLPKGPGEDTAWVAVASDASACDDTLARVDGSSYLPDPEIVRLEFAPVDLGSSLPCDAPVDTVRLRNTGERRGIVTSIESDPPGLFELEHGAPPIGLAAGEEVAVAVRTSRRDSGAFSGAVRFTLSGIDTVISVPVSGRIVAPERLRVTIGREHRAAPGKEAMVPVVLKDGSSPTTIVDLGITELRIRVQYDGSMMLLLNGRDDASLTAGTLLDGWLCTTVVDRLGEYEVIARSAGAAPISGGGELLHLRFMTFLSSTIESEVTAEISGPETDSCLTIESAPGRVKLDSLCGIATRLIELTMPKPSLARAYPNPFTESTSIDFSMPFAAPVRLTISDPDGRVVDVPLDRTLDAGTYRVVLNGRELPTGVYYYTLESGERVETGRLVRTR